MRAHAIGYAALQPRGNGGDLGSLRLQDMDLRRCAIEGLALANRMVIPVRRYGNINLPSSILRVSGKRPVKGRTPYL